MTGGNRVQEQLRDQPLLHAVKTAVNRIRDSHDYDNMTEEERTLQKIGAGALVETVNAIGRDTGAISGTR